MLGILGKKLGMTSVYDEKGVLTAVTAVEAGPCYVIQIKTKEKDGYAAIQLGYGAKKEKNVTKAQLTRFKKANVGAMRFIREIRVKDPAIYTVGQKIEADLFAKGDYVDAHGVSIGRGFQGGVRRWGWKGGPGGHGSMFHRAVGSIQSGSRLGRVTKGHHLPGHMGSDNVTISNLEVLDVVKDKNLIIVKGCIPGHKNSFVVLNEATKRPKGWVRKVVQAPVNKKGSKAGAAKK